MTARRYPADSGSSASMRSVSIFREALLSHVSASRSFFLQSG